MQATKFMRIPFFVSGYLVTEDNLDAIATWCEGHVIGSGADSFVRVPVNRPTDKRQTEARPGTWVIVSMQRGKRSFKVYTEGWLRTQFFELPDEPVDEGIPDEDDSNVVPIPGQRKNRTATNIRHVAPVPR